MLTIRNEQLTAIDSAFRAKFLASLHRELMDDGIIKDEKDFTIPMLEGILNNAIGAAILTAKHIYTFSLLSIQFKDELSKPYSSAVQNILFQDAKEETKLEALKLYLENTDEQQIEQ